MRDYPRDTAAAKRYDGLGAGRVDMVRQQGLETMHALSKSPRMSVIGLLLLVHQAGRHTTDHVQATDEVVMAEKGFGETVRGVPRKPISVQHASKT